MSIDEVMDAAVDYSNASWLDQDKARDALIAAIVLHVAEEVAREREECADVARQWEDNYVIEDSAPRHVDDAIRARAEKEEK